MNIYLGDSAEVLRTLGPESVDSIVTDPPYGIKFMNQSWDINIAEKRIKEYE